MQLISFIVIFCFFIAKINCVVTTNYLDSKYNYLIKHIVNRTNTTRDTFLYNLTLKSDVHLPIDIQESILNAEDKGKICLRNLTKCMERDLDSTATNEIAKELFSRMPPFDLSKINGVSQSCQKDISRYIKDLGQFKMWALQMYDSSSKLPSGILNGNINQLGDFDMCLNAKSEDQIYGKYCLASMQFDAPPNLYLSGIYRLIHSHSHIKSNLDDPGHRVPRFSSINWALCVPNSCSNKDVEIGLRKSLGNLLKRDLKLKVKVDAALCQTKAEEKIVPTSTWIAVAVFIGFFATCCIAAIYDKYWTGENKNKWILAFSLNRNWSSMCTATQNTNDIKAVHGIRFVNALLLLFAHKSMALFFLPWTNRTEYIEYVSQPWSVIGRAASLFTDPFLMFSATLTTYAILGRLEKTKKLNLYQEYVSRLMRIVPTLSALIAFCTFILPWLNNGPMWNLVVTHHANICKRNWWRNLLFIHNYYGFEVMCLTHTHHVGIDTQLFIISPFLIFILWKWPKKGSELLIILALISTIMRYHVTYTLKLSNYVHFGTSIKQLFDTADYMYTLPIYRITVNIMGIFLGYALKFYGNIVLSQTQIRIGSALAFFSFLVSFLGPSFMGSIDYVYNPTDAAMYAAFSPILWCFSFAWIVWTAHLGIRNPVINFFIHPRWIYWTKISYTVYLTQFPAYFYNVGIVRSPEHYEFFRTMFNLKEYVWILVLSCTLTLMFEIPFQNIRNIIFKTSLGKTSNIEPKKKVS